MDCSRIQRRPGTESGPSQFHKILKYSLLVAINDPFSSYLDCFGYLGVDFHSYIEDGYKAKVETIKEGIIGNDLCICIGGDNNALNILTSDNIDTIIKVSPNLSRGEMAEGCKIDNSNYVTCLAPEIRKKIIHFGVLDYTNPQKEHDLVCNVDKAKILFLDKLGQTNAKMFSNELSKIDGKSRIAVMIDCESLTPDYLPGISNPSVFGLVEAEIFEIMEILGKSGKNLSLIIFSNFNPAVESRRSSNCLLYMIYSLLQNHKSAGGSVLAALSDN